ncbi:MAG: hypothetical protein KGD63_04055 [Candidatus Lokiarchaeota archaeon]|nr:hypothetical protein [Candidatus Lokiarchaeota archaeon]
MSEEKDVLKLLLSNDEEILWSYIPFVEHIKKKRDRLYLEETKIFITQKKVFALFHITMVYIILLSEVEYYFTEEVEKAPKHITNVFLKITHKDKESSYNTNYFFRPEKNILEKDTGWEHRYPSLEAFIQLPNVSEKKELIHILKGVLNIREDIPPLKWKKKYNWNMFPFIY